MVGGDSNYSIVMKQGGTPCGGSVFKDELPRSKLRGTEGPSCERFPFRHPGIF